MLIVTPNLCFDRTVTVPRLEPGAVLRGTDVEQTAGGKGVNVLRVLRNFGRPATLIGTFAETEVERMRALLAQEHLESIIIPVDAPQGRTAMIFLSDDGQVTVVNEPGELAHLHQWTDFTKAVEQRMPGAGVLACSGSLPAGAPVDGYASLIEAANAHGLTTVLDTAPAPLTVALGAHPDLVTPNLEEAEAALSGSRGDILVSEVGDVRERALTAAQRLVEAGARRAAVTAGAEGVAFVGTHTHQWLPSPPVRAISAVGAGDSFVAGLLLDHPSPAAGDRAWIDAIRRGVATAAASCESRRPGQVDPSRAAELLAALDDASEPLPNMGVE